MRSIRELNFVGKKKGKFVHFGALFPEEVLLGNVISIVKVRIVNKFQDV